MHQSMHEILIFSGAHTLFVLELFIVFKHFQSNVELEAIYLRGGKWPLTDIADQTQLGSLQ